MKEQDPPIRRIIERPRLLNQLEGTDARTILLIAPAGYGKTTLLRQWAERNHPDCWYTAESGSSDVAQLAIGLATELDSMCPGLADDVSQLVRALPNPARESRSIIDLFADRLSRIRVECVIIDDYHLLAEEQATEALVRGLLERLHVRLLIGSRSPPSWTTARDAVYGDLLEIGAEDLALTDQESEGLLDKAPSSLREELLAHANGWPAVIGLAAVAGSTRRTPRNAISTRLFRFFAEELFATCPPALQDDLLAMALLPGLPRELMEEAFGDSARDRLAEATTKGFVTVDGHEREAAFHPLIREYLFSEIAEHTDARERVEAAVRLSLRLSAWDNALVLIRWFERVDLLNAFLESAFMPLVRIGRIGTLEQVASFARSRSAEFSAAIRLIDAELALRDGAFNRAEALAARSAGTLAPDHVLASHAHWVAGQSAQLSANFDAASTYFRQAHRTARSDAEIRDALSGLLVVSVFSEDDAATDVANELISRREVSPTDLLLATNAALLLRRYGLSGDPFEAECALTDMDAVPDPRLRTGLTNLVSYDAFLRADYEKARRLAESTIEQSLRYQLSWAVPHAEWVLAAACLGLRDFAHADRRLRRVEHAATALDDPHLSLNAAALRARLLLALNQTERAHLVLCIDDSRAVNPAMRAELVAMRGLVLAVLGDNARATLAANQAQTMTRSVEVLVLVACIRAVCLHDPTDAFRLAQQFDVWDPLVCTMRAHPPFLESLASEPSQLSQLRTLLRRSNDYDLARRANIPVGTRPRARRGGLSRREHDVMQLVIQGLTDKQIGRLLFISPGTAKVHVQHILEKLDAHNRAEAAAKYFTECE